MRLDKVKIRLLMAACGYNNTKLGEAAGIKRQNISTLLNRGTCRADTVLKLAKALAVDPVEIVKDEE